MSSEPPPPQLSPDGRFYWDGVRWIPTRTLHLEAADPGVAISESGANLIARGGRWLTRDERLWWDGDKWLPYRRITWNSIHIHSNPPEDLATLSRNLGIWCAGLGILGVFGLRLGAFSIMAAVAGPVSIYNAQRYFSYRRAHLRGLPGERKAIAGLILSVVGLSGFLLAIVLFIATR